MRWLWNETRSDAKLTVYSMAYIHVWHKIWCHSFGVQASWSVGSPMVAMRGFGSNHWYSMCIIDCLILSICKIPFLLVVSVRSQQPVSRLSSKCMEKISYTITCANSFISCLLSVSFWILSLSFGRRRHCSWVLGGIVSPVVAIRVYGSKTEYSICLDLIFTARFTVCH